jgi:hypothetical protein
VEGWHHGVTYTVIKQNQKHVLSLIDGLKLEQSHTTHLYTRLKSGTNESKRHPRYIELDERINNIIDEYSFDTLGDFFRGNFACS